MDSPQLENPVLNDADAKEAESIVSDLQQLDQSQGLSSADAQPEPRVPDMDDKPEVPSDQPTPSPETKAEPEPQKQGHDPATGQFLPKDQQPAPETVPDAKPETPYSKAQKDEQRLSRNRREFEEEKLRWRAQQEAEARVIEQQRQAAHQRANAPRYTVDGQQATAEQLASTAQNLWVQAKAHLKAGNYEEHEKHLDLAEKAQIAANEAYQYEANIGMQQQQQQLAHQYRVNMEAEFARDPELQNPEAPIHKYLGSLLEKEPYFGQTTDGFAKAKQVAQWQMEAELASGLREQNKKLTAEVERLTKGATPLGSGPSSAPPSRKKFEDMDLDEMGESIRQSLAEMPALMH